MKGYIVWANKGGGPAINKAGLSRSAGWVIIQGFSDLKDAQNFAKNYRGIAGRKYDMKITLDDKMQSL